MNGANPCGAVIQKDLDIMGTSKRKQEKTSADNSRRKARSYGSLRRRASKKKQLEAAIRAWGRAARKVVELREEIKKDESNNTICEGEE